VARLVVLFCVFFILITIGCRQVDDITRIAVIHSIENPELAAMYQTFAQKTADSLNMQISIINAGSTFSTAHYDSLLSGVNVIFAPATIKNAGLAEIVAKQKRTPLVQHKTHDYKSEDYYRAGQKAGRHVAKLFGESGRFGIFTSSLNNMSTNESIRGFREELMTAQNKWRQVNIITFGTKEESALAQFRDLNRFGARIVWLFADGNRPFFESLKANKKNNYFIAVDLHASKNYIKLLEEKVLDAIASKNVKADGRASVLEAEAALTNQEQVDTFQFNASILLNTDSCLVVE
jgi:hypothetical protein